MRMLLVVISAVIALSSLSIAQSDKYPFAIADMDTDRDGKVSWEEFKAYLPELSRWEFGGADLNNDGYITAAEWSTFTNR